MTLSEMLAMPKGMTPEEYQILLDEKKRLEKKIGTESNKIQCAEDALEILSDEVGSERYKKHEVIIEKAQKAVQKAQNRLAEIKRLIEGGN
jgi:hypothetical protein